MKFSRLIPVVVVAAVIGSYGYVGRAFWYTRTSQLAGVYRADGAWGRSTLTLHADHTFQQSVDFTNQFNGKPEGSKSISGHWTQRERALLSQTIQLSSFISPSPLNNQAVSDNFEVTYGALGTSFGMAIDPGANIYYWKLDQAR
jgi:hypothetical protein